MSWQPLLVEFKMIFLSTKKPFFISFSLINLFSSLFSSDVHVSERQAQALAHYIRVNGTTIVRQARNLFLWNNLTNSIIVKTKTKKF